MTALAYSNRFYSALYTDPILDSIYRIGRDQEFFQILQAFPSRKITEKNSRYVRTMLRDWGISCTQSQAKTVLKTVMDSVECGFYQGLLWDRFHTMPYEGLTIEALHRIGPSYPKAEPFLFELMKNLDEQISSRIFKLDLQFKSRSIKSNIDVCLQNYVIPTISMYAVVRMRGGQFTRFVLGAFQLIGWSGRITKESGDEGGDILLTDPYGNTWIFQVKRLKKNAGHEIYRDAFAARDSYGVQNAAIVTSSFPTESTKRACDRVGIRIYDHSSCQGWICNYRNSPFGPEIWNRCYNWYTSQPMPVIYQ